MFIRLIRNLDAANDDYHAQFEGDDDALKTMGHPEWDRTLTAARTMLGRQLRA